MEQSKQLVSRELAERMKELGFPQESVYKYCGGHMDYHDSDNGVFEKCDNTDLLDDDEYCHTAGMNCEYTISAYSVAELGEMLEKANMKHTTFVKAYLQVMDLSWDDLRSYDGLVQMCINLITQPDIPAQMLIWLAEQNLINPKDIKI